MLSWPALTTDYRVCQAYRACIGILLAALVGSLWPRFEGPHGFIVDQHASTVKTISDIQCGGLMHCRCSAAAGILGQPEDNRRHQGQFRAGNCPSRCREPRYSRQSRAGTWVAEFFGQPRVKKWVAIAIILLDPGLNVDNRPPDRRQTAMTAAAFARTLP
jgi:hypothetical protein